MKPLSYYVDKCIIAVYMASLLGGVLVCMQHDAQAAGDNKKVVNIRYVASVSGTDYMTADDFLQGSEKAADKEGIDRTVTEVVAESVQLLGPRQEKPEAPAGWTCACGAVNTGKFCTECGAKKPEDAPVFRCSKCGWEPEDPANPPKFCPECGDKFDESDIKA